MAKVVLDRWAVKWVSDNSLDGKSEHFCLYKNCELIGIFRTRKEACKFRDDEYGYIRHRKDLRSEPHGWRVPKIVRVIVTIKEVKTWPSTLAVKSKSKER
jgi:hypothetical protein